LFGIYYSFGCCPQIGFITFDSTVHIYNLRSTLKAPQQFVLADLADIFLPAPDDMLGSYHIIYVLLRVCLF
jgi:hypothetical protein